MTSRILMATTAVGLMISGAAIAANPSTAPAGAMTPQAANSNSAMPATTATTTTTTTPAPAAAMTAQTGKTVSDLTAGNAEFSTLEKALKATGLDQILASKGPYTVFAPTNAAFAKLGTAKLNDLMKPENKAELTQILTYHVVPQNLPNSPTAQPTSLPTAEGQQISVTRQATGYQIQNAHSLGAPMGASNGSIIAIDTVLTPEAQAKMGMAPVSALAPVAPGTVTK
jgi:uncharacterized surface protein with fasciclin (FAS1) repeats